MNSVPDEHQDDIILGLKNLRVKYTNKIIIGRLTIHSLRNKFELLSSLIGGKIDTFMISETKLDATFPTNQFFIQGYSTVYRLDRYDKGGGIMLFVKDGIITFPSDQYSFPVEFEAFCTELNLRRKKWLVFCIYNPHNRFIKHHLKELRKTIEFYSKMYENIMIMGDFNAEISEPNSAFFCTFCNFKSLINKPTCYKNPDNPSCIDLILTNCLNYFQNSLTFETGLSDFHKLILTLFKSEIPQQRPNIISHQNYKRFDSHTFECVISKKTEENTSMDFEVFKRTTVDTLDKYAPLKKKYLRANHSNFVTKELSKAIINRSKLRNQFLKNRSVESSMKYNKQRNICVALLRKTKRKYYEDLRLSDVNDNK